MKLGTVVGVYLSDDTYENFNSITVSLRDRGSKNLLRCTPLDTNSRKIPVIGEQVYVLVGNSDEASGASNSTKNYYLSTVGIQNNVNHNALPKLTKAEGSSVPNFGQVSNGIPAQSSTDSPNDLGIGFEEVSNLSQLQPFIGDVIHEGRFGQSIRFGYTPQGTKGNDNRIKGVVTEPSWKSTDPKSPITIIRNGAGESRGYNKFVIEDINKDDSSIWLGSKQTIGLTPSNSFTLGVTPTNLYKNPQIVLNSDRIVLNSKSDSVLISGDKSVNVSTPNWKADMDVIFSQLESITDALLQLAPQLTAAANAGGPVPSLSAGGPQLLSTITQVKTQLELMKQ
jgi:hypothetical protein